jgi:hypothetical protein
VELPSDIRRAERRNYSKPVAEILRLQKSGRLGIPATESEGQTLNEAPQPQLFLTFGLFSLKPDSIRASE